MLLWKEMYPERRVDAQERDWDTWGRPVGSYIDLGCVSLTNKPPLIVGQWLACAYLDLRGELIRRPS